MNQALFAYLQKHADHFDFSLDHLLTHLPYNLDSLPTNYTSGHNNFLINTTKSLMDHNNGINGSFHNRSKNKNESLLSNISNNSYLNSSNNNDYRNSLTNQSNNTIENEVLINRMLDDKATAHPAYHGNKHNHRFNSIGKSVENDNLKAENCGVYNVQTKKCYEADELAFKSSYFKEVILNDVQPKEIPRKNVGVDKWSRNVNSQQNVDTHNGNIKGKVFKPINSNKTTQNSFNTKSIDDNYTSNFHPITKNCANDNSSRTNAINNSASNNVNSSTINSNTNIPTDNNNNTINSNYNTTFNSNNTSNSTKVETLDSSMTSMETFTNNFLADHSRLSHKVASFVWFVIITCILFEKEHF